ncbi:PEP-CTERM sorting domain-containing protein [Thalassoglobus sp. JC818]|uniref:PEP-CTERM sorting domain-containing protein n=1 Tax=Thalassoglobus sp. JC818 TaxID=3232136 RepID=UPI00345A93AB
MRVFIICLCSIFFLVSEGEAGFNLRIEITGFKYTDTQELSQGKMIVNLFAIDHNGNGIIDSSSEVPYWRFSHTGFERLPGLTESSYPGTYYWVSFSPGDYEVAPGLKMGGGGVAGQIVFGGDTLYRFSLTNRSASIYSPIMWQNDVSASNATINVYSVPEPTSFALIGIGIAGSAYFQRRKHQARACEEHGS